MEQQNSTARGPGFLRIAGLGAATALACTALLGAGSSALAAYFARRIITPDRIKTEEDELLAVVRGPEGLEGIFRATPETTVDGVYSFHFNGGAGHARIGAITSYSPLEGTVQRRIEAVYSGDIHHVRWGRWGGATYSDPGGLGLEFQEVTLESDIGAFPAWLVPAPVEPDGGRRSRHAAGAAQQVWAVMVHGRGATRLEGLRALPVAQELGLTSLLISYRNDGEAPIADAGRYGLGSTEWREAEAAIAYALENGATDVVLFGWSMGGAVSLQAADLSRNRHAIRALVLDAPVIDWVDVLAFQARLNKIPAGVGRYGQLMLTHPLGRRLTGLSAPVDLKSMDWVSRAVELRTPALIMHSLDDDFVPPGPAERLADRNPGMVDFVPFHKARHTKEWNVDRERWEVTVRDWLSSQLEERATPGAAH
ncbi:MULTISPECIES: alpha/beta fold hydrolase [Arthrobacter]|uniref:Alpha/beta fold hydrolase n=2 Tax=Arthrobacter TaxID=1663 RepID=A0ABU9KI66_9MICC|nr:alpha/beta fold hydrolase [Arthrobacter sp. YJM1]MDP5225888.1 prolyl oligopeptidase family serine peptidase [Arthrobacter sp. YJM1]